MAGTVLTQMHVHWKTAKLGTCIAMAFTASISGAPTRIVCGNGKKVPDAEVDDGHALCRSARAAMKVANVPS